jgi:hypothetical protein
MDMEESKISYGEYQETVDLLKKTEEELQKTKDQLYLANKTISEEKDLLLNISKAALQMV